VITYYQDRTVQVTSTGVRMDGQAYRLGEFVRVWHSRGRRSFSSVAGRGALGLAMIVPVLAGALGILIAMSIDASVSVTIALVGGGILLGLGALPLADVLLEKMDQSYARGSRNLEIWADVRSTDPRGADPLGARVLLLRTDDALRFGKIYRALQRALEHGEPAPRR
jgi:hypothetical protein